jgi:hypothetical protein
MNKTVYKSGVSNKFSSNGILALPYILSRPPNKSAIAFLFSSVKSVFVLSQFRAFLFFTASLFSSFYKNNATTIMIFRTIRNLLGVVKMILTVGRTILGQCKNYFDSRRMVFGVVRMILSAGRTILGQCNNCFDNLRMILGTKIMIIIVDRMILPASKNNLTISFTSKLQQIKNQ